MGALSELLNNNISEQTDKEALASAAGIELSTLDQILAGEIECPPQRRLAAMASYLSISVSSLEDAGNNDGCNYNGEPDAHAKTLGDLMA